MESKNEDSQQKLDRSYNDLSRAFKNHLLERKRLSEEFDRLWKNIKPMVVETLGVEADFLELCKSQLKEHLIDPQNSDFSKETIIGELQDDGSTKFILPEVNYEKIIEVAKKIHSEIKDQLTPVLPSEILNKEGHLITLLYELGILEVINKRFKDAGEDSGTSKARLIGTIIGKTDSSKIENIRKYLSAIEIANHKNNPINASSIKEVKKILTEYGLSVKNLPEK
jgi:hypothetical protein